MRDAAPLRGSLAGVALAACLVLAACIDLPTKDSTGLAQSGRPPGSRQACEHGEGTPADILGDLLSNLSTEERKIAGTVVVVETSSQLFEARAAPIKLGDGLAIHRLEVGRPFIERIVSLKGGDMTVGLRCKPSVDNGATGARENAIAFVLSHELGHLMHGDEQQIAFSAEKEKSADQFALQLLQETGYFPTMSVLGAIVISRIHESVRPALNALVEEVSSFPSPDRLSRILFDRDGVIERLDVYVSLSSRILEITRTQENQQGDRRLLRQAILGEIASFAEANDDLLNSYQFITERILHDSAESRRAEAMEDYRSFATTISDMRSLLRQHVMDWKREIDVP